MAGQDLPDGRLVHAVEPPDLSHGHGSSEPTNGPDVIVTELAWMRGAVDIWVRMGPVPPVTSLGDTIAIVRGTVTEKEVLQANAAAVVAGVQNARSQRDWTVGKSPRDPMGTVVPALEQQPAVPVLESTRPFLTVSNLCDVSPEGRSVHGAILP